MAKFIAETAIQHALTNLRSTSIKGSPFFAYLILRRHSVLQGSPNELPITGKSLIPAVQEAALVDGESVDFAYYSPLEAKYRKKRWGETNGPSDNINGWASRDGGRDLVDKLEGRDVMTIRLLPFSPEAATKLFSLKQAGRPDCVDIAIWWNRGRDVSNLLNSNGELDVSTIREVFISELGLQRDEVATLFSSPSMYPDDATIALSNDRADPKSYLPAPQPRRTKQPEYALRTYEPGSCAQLIDAINDSGFIFSDEQVATFLTAVRTKPFVILAGVSGTGKTHLPITIAKSTCSEYYVAAVAPSWIDGSQLVGYRDIQGVFHPGPLLTFAERAQSNPDVEHFFILDEMNLARVEYYLSDVLSCMETMEVNPETGRLESLPLSPDSGSKYGNVRIPSNLCIVGSINMDESTHTISKKVLDRAFILEFNDIDLTVQNQPSTTSNIKQAWTASEWGADRPPLFGTCGLDSNEFQRVSTLLNDLNSALRAGGFNFGFRLRNEICAFVANAANIEAYFSGMNEASSSLDVAIKSKVLSRLEGHTLLLGDILTDLRDIMTRDAGGVVIADAETKLQRSINKISDMANMLERTGYSSYWI